MVSGHAATQAKGRVGIIKEVGRTGAYGALALLTLALEGVLLAWFARASSSAERITAGILMVVVLLALIGAIGWIEFLRRPAAPLPLQQAAATLDKKGVPAEEIERVPQAGAAEQQEPDEPISAPDASYVIARPPIGWTVRPTTLEALVKEQVGASNISAFPLPVVSSILLLEFGAPLAWTPQPEKTRVRGRRLPMLLAEPIGRKLQIMSLRVRQPPLYIERTLYDTVVTHLAGLVQAGIVSLVSITSRKLPKTNRDTIVVEMTQEFENIVIGDRERDVVRFNNRMTAIRGDLYDYLLLATNFRFGGDSDPIAEQVDAQIARLLDSFRVLSVPDPAEEARKDGESADRDFNEFISSQGVMLFRGQLDIAAGRLADLDLSSAAGIARAVALLLPFRTFAGMLHDTDLGFGDLWTALDQAVHGDTQPLRDFLLAHLPPPPAGPAPAAAPRTS